ncbi:MAG: UDP-3-O-(3-hydroxymyristoyl)glucosamine N-acyltransferase [Thermoproteota archaeon]|nr:UDP-3-O-(3-hydroxymyristoyl)glucosamine N-acyltransferase [Thermoproteota archaeon]
MSSLEEATENDLSFCSNRGQEAIESISKSNAGIIFCSSDLQGAIMPARRSQCLIFVDNPRLAFIKAVSHIQKNEAVERKISSHALISKTAKIGSNCSIGDLTIIGDNCSIGENTVIYDRVSLVRDCKIGRNCTIQSGVTMGFDGFAYERLPDGELEKFPHLRGVIIGDNVEISSSCLVARGSLTDTEIGDGTKLDAAVYVAHNVKIGRNCLLTGGARIGGTVRIGDQCWIGLNCTIKQKVRIGNNAIVGAGSLVLHDVSNEDIVAGVPAKSIKHKVTTDKLFMMAGQNKK